MSPSHAGLRDDDPFPGTRSPRLDQHDEEVHEQDYPAGFVPGRLVRSRPRKSTRGRVPRGAAGGRVWAVVAVVTALHVLALALLWPHGEDKPLKARANAYRGVTFVTGSVLSVKAQSCAADMTDRQADGSIPSKATCYIATVKITDGAGERNVTTAVPPQIVRSRSIHPGDRLQLSSIVLEPGQAPIYTYVDFARRPPMLLLGALFLVVVVAVGRWRGLLAVVGLLLAYVTVAMFVLPALLAGRNAVLVGAISAGLIMSVILYLVHGLSDKTTTALLGTLSGIWITAGLAWWITGTAHLHGLVSEDNFTVSRLTTGGDLKSIVLCGMILAGLGILNDVTITQASAVWELRAHAPDMTHRETFASAMQIGRDHMASTVYTIAFAYAGVALPVLLLVDLYGQPLNQLLTSGAVAEEIARTLVASVGLIVAIPLTTAIGVALSSGVRPAVEPTGRRPHFH